MTLVQAIPVDQIVAKLRSEAQLTVDNRKESDMVSV